MESWFEIGFILGAVQGLTEFLPVSSTGHLIIVGDLLGFVGPKASTFEVAIQLGSILAVVVLYWRRFMGLLFPARFTAPAAGPRPFAGLRGIGLLFLTTLPPSILGLLLHAHIKALFTPASVAAALTVGALLMLLVEHRCKKHPAVLFTLDEMTPKLALGIGCCQCLALWPGFSRSASTIMGGMLLGAKRGLAAEYSFIAAVPLMVAATGYDLLKTWTLFSSADLPLFATGMVFSFLFAFAAIKTFIALVGRLTLRPFAYYRLALAPLVYLFLS
ncbi:MAG: undecaprenyl-diphosphate phosphatase [Bilophila sp.]